MKAGRIPLAVAGVGAAAGIAVAVVLALGGPGSPRHPAVETSSAPSPGTTVPYRDATCDAIVSQLDADQSKFSADGSNLPQLVIDLNSLVGQLGYGAASATNPTIHADLLTLSDNVSDFASDAQSLNLSKMQGDGSTVEAAAAKLQDDCAAATS